MAINYNVISQEEIDKMEQERFCLISEGIYPAEVIDAFEKISKSSGNPMFELHLRVYGDDGTLYDLNDYLIPGNKKVYYKFRNFIESIGDMNLLNGQTDANDLIGKSVSVIIKNKKESYESNGYKKEVTKSFVMDYVPKDKNKNIYESLSSLNDDIPF